MEQIAGRKLEIEIMRKVLNRPHSDFLAMYGRRRIGKTFLIRTVYKRNIAFEMAGVANANMASQLQHFPQALNKVYPKGG